MRPLLLLAAALAAVTATAHAAPPARALPPGGPPPQGSGGPDGPPPGGGLFISPDGEPFRAGDGRADWFARADADHDGALTLAEFRADAMSFFGVLDANRDGLVDGTENQIYERRIAPEITRMSFDGPGGGHPPGGGPGGGHRGGGKGQGAIGREGAARFGLLNEPQPVLGADANLDGRITAEEWAKAAGRRFGLLDKDGDGRLTLASLPGALGPGGKPRKPDAKSHP